MTNVEWLERRALKVLQSGDMPLYLFTLAAEEIDLVADVARISRDEAGKLIGYQRPEKQKHVKQIQDYLDSEDPLFPNGLILALPPRSVGSRVGGRRRAMDSPSSGTLEIPIASDADGPRPAWIVDGQQRSLALVSNQEPSPSCTCRRLRRADSGDAARAVPAGQHGPTTAHGPGDRTPPGDHARTVGAHGNAATPIGLWLTC